MRKNISILVIAIILSAGMKLTAQEYLRNLPDEKHTYERKLSRYGCGDNFR